MELRRYQIRLVNEITSFMRTREQVMIIFCDERRCGVTTATNIAACYSCYDIEYKSGTKAAYVWKLFSGSGKDLVICDNIHSVKQFDAAINRCADAHKFLFCVTVRKRDVKSMKRFISNLQSNCVLIELMTPNKSNSKL